MLTPFRTGKAESRPDETGECCSYWCDVDFLVSVIMRQIVTQRLKSMQQNERQKCLL